MKNMKMPTYEQAKSSLDKIANSCNSWMAVYPHMSIGDKESWETFRNLVSYIKSEEDKNISEEKETFKEGDLVLYQNGSSFELGVIKKIRDPENFWVYYHTGDTGALTNIRNLHKIKNEYAFEIERLKVK